MECNCGYGQGSDIIYMDALQEGDTYTLLFQYKEDDVAMDLPSGYDMIVALYDNMGDVLQCGKVSDNTLSYVGNHTYGMDVTHAASMKAVGTAQLELTITNANRTVVDHASNVVGFRFSPRRNNNLL